MNAATVQIRSLPIWKNEIELVPLSGGLTNINYHVKDGENEFVVRFGEDIVPHQVMRFNELAASEAAHAAGLSPRVVHSQEGILVLEFIRSKTLEPADIRKESVLPRVLELIKKCHYEVPNHLRGPSLVFWVFHIIRDYAGSLRQGDSQHIGKLDDLQARARALEDVAGPYDIVFGHNDLIAGNFLDDGKRLWMLDWDYAGFNTPLFDLANLASNNEFSTKLESWLLENYYEKQPDEELWKRYQAMKCASLLREAMWSMVSEMHSQIEFDFLTYTNEYLMRFEEAYSAFKSM